MRPSIFDSCALAILIELLYAESRYTTTGLQEAYVKATSHCKTDHFADMRPDKRLPKSQSGISGAPSSSYPEMNLSRWFTSLKGLSLILGILKSAKSNDVDSAPD